jgi:hypothetical protein
MGFSPPRPRQKRAERNRSRVAEPVVALTKARTRTVTRRPAWHHRLARRLARPALRGNFTPHRRPQLFDMAVFLGLFALLLLLAPGLDYFLTSQDHGYQLSVGTQILLGKIPGVEIVIAYGPAVMYTSALGLWLSHSMVGETILCAGGYAVALFLIYRLVRELSSRSLGIAAAGLAFLLLARFYKWYIWLIPLATLWALYRHASSPPNMRIRWACICGLVLGACWLYRPDMGTIQLLIGLAVVALAEVRWPAAAALTSPARKVGQAFQPDIPPEIGACQATNHPVLRGIEVGQAFQPDIPPQVGTCQPKKPDLLPYANTAKLLSLVIATFSVPLFLWLGYLVLRAGPHAPLDYFDTTLAGALAIARGMAQQIPADGDVMRAYLLAPAVLLVAACVALFREFTGRGSPRTRFLVAASLVGLGAAHQAMHRMGPAHLIQVLPPVIVCGFVSFAAFRSWAVRAPLRNATTWAITLSGVAYFSLLLIGALGLMPWGRQDLVGLSSSLSQRYWELAHPRLAAVAYPAGRVIDFVRQHTSDRESILVFPFDCQLYTLAERKLSGRLHGYYAGVLDDGQSQTKNLAAICREMPKLVVLPSDRKPLSATDPIAILIARSRQSHHHVEQFLRAHYTRVEYDDGEFVVFGRSS